MLYTYTNEITKLWIILEVAEVAQRRVRARGREGLVVRLGVPVYLHTWGGRGRITVGSTEA
ncbi:hypothetical protein QQ045_012622 [Rhodiola kirilowii]